MFFYKHMKFRNQARLCLAIYDFEARRFEKNLTPMWLRSVNILLVIFIDL